MLPYARRAHNINVNYSTKCSPYYAIYGVAPNVTGLFEDIYSNLTPLEYGAKTSSTLKKAYCAMKMCQAEADNNVRNRNSPKNQIVEIIPGDKVLIKRDQAVSAKTTNLPWVGPYNVSATNDSIVKIEKDNKIDFIHRTQVVKVTSRKNHLKPVIELPGGQNFTGKSGGSEVEEMDKSTQQNEDLLAKNARPMRVRKNPERLQIQPNAKSYI